MSRMSLEKRGKNCQCWKGHLTKVPGWGSTRKLQGMLFVLLNKSGTGRGIEFTCRALQNFHADFRVLTWTLESRYCVPYTRTDEIWNTYDESYQEFTVKVQHWLFKLLLWWPNIVFKILHQLYGRYRYCKLVLWQKKKGDVCNTMPASPKSPVLCSERRVSS